MLQHKITFQTILCFPNSLKSRTMWKNLT
uniref:Uncharacterized protein n=1 Tax=Anguilla anguilla TaxID=7936 RepID=A0A0E9QJS5_ANGAN